VSILGVIRRVKLGRSGLPCEHRAGRRIDPQEHEDQRWSHLAHPAVEQGREEGKQARSDRGSVEAEGDSSSTYPTASVVQHAIAPTIGPVVWTMWLRNRHACRVVDC